MLQLFMIWCVVWIKMKTFSHFFPSNIHWIKGRKKVVWNFFSFWILPWPSFHKLTSLHHFYPQKHVILHFLFFICKVIKRLWVFQPPFEEMQNQKRSNYSSVHCIVKFPLHSLITFYANMSRMDHLTRKHEKLLQILNLNLNTNRKYK